MFRILGSESFIIWLLKGLENGLPGLKRGHISRRRTQVERDSEDVQEDEFRSEIPYVLLVETQKIVERLIIPHTKTQKHKDIESVFKIKTQEYVNKVIRSLRSR
jgi:hypothetical protein